MKKTALVTIMLIGLIPAADACVGRILSVGFVQSMEGQVMAEMVSTIISERTGTTVNVRVYKSSQELYDAVKVKQVDILIENTAKALQVLNQSSESAQKRAYEIVKAGYEQEKGLIWLRPFGYISGSGSESAPVLRVEVFSDFPALPRVVEKLGGIITDDGYAKMIRNVESGEKPRKVAREFLKAKKLI